MENIELMHSGWVQLFVDPSIALWHLAWVHTPIVILCLIIAFRVRGQSGGLFIMAGVGLLLLHQWVSLLSYHAELFTVLVTVLPPRIGTAVMFGSLLVAYGLIGIGIMKPHLKLVIPDSRMQFWLNSALFVAVIIELCLMADKLFVSNAVSSERGLYSLAELAQLLSITILLAVVSCKHYQHATFARRAADTERQLEAMLSMFTAVKHDLNNDMQVVVGNAELAEILIENNGDVRKPVANIAQAANMAVERIEQLSVFSAAVETTPTAIDLNAVLRESTTRILAEIPSIVTLRTDLAHLPIRIMADRYLLGLSLSYLIRQAVKTMEHGGEIVVRTRDVSRENTKPGMAVVMAEVFIVRGLSSPSTEKSRLSEKIEHSHIQVLKQGISTTKALVERSGAVTVGQSLSPGRSLISMGFLSEPVTRCVTSVSAALPNANA